MILFIISRYVLWRSLYTFSYLPNLIPIQRTIANNAGPLVSHENDQNVSKATSKPSKHLAILVKQM